MKINSKILKEIIAESISKVMNETYHSSIELGQQIYEKVEEAIMDKYPIKSAYLYVIYDNAYEEFVVDILEAHQIGNMDRNYLYPLRELVRNQDGYVEPDADKIGKIVDIIIINNP